MTGKPLVALSREDWVKVIRALRHYDSNLPLDEAVPVEQDFDRIADEIKGQL